MCDLTCCRYQRVHRGAEWFYAGFFNVNEDSHGRMPPSSQWCWQGMMPSYAQATFTQAAPLLYEGALVFADANTTYAVKTNAKNYTYLFPTNAPVVPRPSLRKSISDRTVISPPKFRINF